MAERTITLQVSRCDPQTDAQPHLQTYEVKARAGMTVLEALFEVADRQDHSLAFRYSCRSAVCGSCSMFINGAYRLACATQVNDFAGPVVVHPLPGMTVIRDLVVDLEPFFAKYERIKPYLITHLPEPKRERLQSPEQRKRIDEMVNCILCACCQSSCPMSWGNDEYLGPAVLLKANRFLADSRDEGLAERLPVIAGEDGVWRCHTVFNCVEACPKGLNPTHSIQQLKRRSMRARLAPWRNRNRQRAMPQNER